MKFVLFAVGLLSLGQGIVHRRKLSHKYCD